MNATPVTPESFFSAWVLACSAIEETLLAQWDDRPNYTSTVMRNYPEGSLVQKLGQKLQPPLKVYCDYYHIDAVFFDPKADQVKDTPPAHETWLQNIRIAFEHEHSFRSGLYKEVSHLLITRCELRVLVTYPEKKHNKEAELQKLKNIVLASSIADEANFLVILGTIEERPGTERIHWDGRAFRNRDWQRIPQVT